jgi:UDP-N-acetylmuramate dehydrogenase
MHPNPAQETAQASKVSCFPENTASGSGSDSDSENVTSIAVSEGSEPLGLGIAPSRPLEAVLEAQVSLARFTSFQVGGPAQWYAAPKTLMELQQCLDWAKAEGLPVTALGAGSNLLISDAGIPGLVLSVRNFLQSRYEADSGLATVSAGIPFPKVSWEVARRGWQGLEWAAGIPGTVGGAVVMNAGAQGGCVADNLVSLQVFGPEGLETWGADRLDYRYRHSMLQGSAYVVLQATFQLQPGGDAKAIRDFTSRNLNQRKATQPYDRPSCGSVFRNPEPLKAARLIEETGLKGFQIGNAQVAERHANFILNCGDAKAQDIFRLIWHVRDTVAQKWDVRLEPEVKMLGDFT